MAFHGPGMVSGPRILSRVFYEKFGNNQKMSSKDLLNVYNK
jgi:hypothetical protein